MYVEIPRLFFFLFFVHDGKFYSRIRVFQFLNIQNRSLFPRDLCLYPPTYYRNSPFNCNRKEKVIRERQFIRA